MRKQTIDTHSSVKDRQLHRQTDRQTDRELDKQTDWQADIQTGLAGRQTVK